MKGIGGMMPGMKGVWAVSAVPVDEVQDDVAVLVGAATEVNAAPAQQKAVLPT